MHLKVLPINALGKYLSTKVTKFFHIPLRQLKVAILKFSLMYLINNVHAAASGIQLPLPLKPAASSNLFIYRLEEAAAASV